MSSVNTIFNPEYIDSLYPKPARYRRNLLAEARTTNYGVVRLELIETLYERMYDQRRELGSDEQNWPHRIMGGRRVVHVEPGAEKLRLSVQYAPLGEAEDVDAPLNGGSPVGGQETLDADLIVAATGYQRSAHIDILQALWPLLPEKSADSDPQSPIDGWEVQCKTPATEGKSATSTRVLEVARDYRVRFSPGRIAPGSGVWLQGCCEGTHGVRKRPSHQVYHQVTSNN